MTIRVMQDNVICNLGFENKTTIRFFEICESKDMERIEKEYNKIMNK